MGIARACFFLAYLPVCFGASFALRMSLTCHVQVLVASMIKSSFFHGRPYCSWNLPRGTAMWTAFSVHCSFEFRLHYESTLSYFAACGTPFLHDLYSLHFSARLCLRFCLLVCLLVLFRVVSLLCADRAWALFEAHAPLAMPVPFLFCSRFILFTQSCLMQTCARRGSLLRGKKAGPLTRAWARLPRPPSGIFNARTRLSCNLVFHKGGHLAPCPGCTAVP